MTMDHITDHADRALAFVLSQYDDSPRLRKLIELIAAEVQKAEDLAYDLLTLRLLDNATGVILSVFGKVVVLERLDTDDDDAYRGMISVAILANNSDTSADTCAAVLAGCVGETVRYQWDGPMRMLLEYETDEGPTAAEAQRICTLIGRAVGGGVAWRISEGSIKGEAFRFNDGPGFGTGRLGRIVGASS